MLGLHPNRVTLRGEPRPGLWINLLQSFWLPTKLARLQIYKKASAYLTSFGIREKISEVFRKIRFEGLCSASAQNLNSLSKNSKRSSKCCSPHRCCGEQMFGEL
jgi:hypothetical protein